jgi:FHA domain
LSKQNALEVLVFGKAGFIGSFVFNSSKVTIGRASDAMVRLDDPQVSLQHATLTLDGGLFRIKDHGSRTGTRVNGAPILPRQPVEPTDELAIGPFRLRVTMCEPDEDESTQTELPEDDATMRLASLVADISRPTAEPFFPPSARGHNGAKTRGEPPARVGRPEPHPRFPTDSELGDSGEATLVRSSEKPPPYSPPSTRPLAREARGPSESPLPKPAKLPQSPTSAPSSAPSSAHRSERPPRTDAFGPASYAISERPATRVNPHHLDTAPEAVPVAFSLAFPDAEPGQREDYYDDDDDDDDSNFVPAFDLLDEVSAAAVDEETARGKSLSLELVHSRGGRILSMEYPKVKGPLRVAGVKDALGAIEKDGTVSLRPDACQGLRVMQGGREISPAKLMAKSPGNMMPFLAGMQARIDLPGDDRVLIQWVPKAYAVDIPPLELRPSRDGMTSGGFSLGVHIAAAMFIGLVVLGDSDRVDADINAGRFATISTKELELEPPPPPPPPPPQEAPTVDNAPTIEMPVNPHDLSPKSKSKVVVKGAPATEAPAQNTPTASTQKILSALGGASNSASAISVTNLDALPSGVGGDFKVSGAVGKAPGDTLRIAAAGSGKDVDTKTASELGANKIGRVQGTTSGGAVRARVTSAPMAARGEGHLDRGEIQKVVNAHLFQIQGCYERQLAKDPSLSGKIAFEWDVGLSGGVSNVRVGRSSVHSVEVTSCIQSAIQGWHFPTPQGGTVTVTYPFAFSALGG